MSAGLKIVVFGTDPQTRNQYIVVAIAAAFRSHPDVAQVSVLHYADVVRYCADNTVDLFIAIGGAGAIVEPLRRAIEYVHTSVLWTTEDPYELNRNMKLAGMFDIVFTNDANALPFYPPSTKHLSFAASDKFHDMPVLHEPRDFLFDLFFVGTAWPERVSAINSLLSHLSPDLRKKIGLSGNPHLPNFHLGDLDLITNFRLAPREFARMANRSVVSLTLDRAYSNSGINNVLGGTPPPRVFELALAGTAQIYVTERSTVQEYFVVGDELLVVASMKDAAEAVQDLVQNPRRRRKIATAARERALRDHLYSNRATAILQAARERNSPRTSRRGVKNRKRILLVSHNMAGIQPFGGVELYQETQAQVLSEHDFFILYPDRNTGHLNLHDMKYRTNISFDAGPIKPSRMSDPLREKILGDVIQKHNFDLVHYHHLIGHPLSLPLISYAFGLPSIYQMHDYYSLCHEFTLLGYGKTYCNIQDSRVESCDICLSTRGLAPPGAQAQRRWLLTNVLGRIDAFVHNSEYTKRKFAQIYPDLDMSVHHVVGNTARLETINSLGEIAGNSDRKNRQSERLQVAILGNFSRPKGGDLLVAMFWQMVRDPIDIHIIGRVDPEFRNVLLKVEFANVKVHGEFDQTNLAFKLRDMDVSVHFSIWPETYCISLDEARAAGLVPIVLGYGALAERVKNGIDGIVIDREHPFDLVKVLRRYSVDPAQLKSLRYDCSKLTQGHDLHFEALEQIYQDLFTSHSILGPPHIGTIGRPLLLSDLGLRFGNNDWAEITVAYDQNQKEETPLAFWAEQQEIVSQPLPVTGSISVEAGLRPGDDTLWLVADEVMSSIATEKVVFVPKFKDTLVVGIGIPIGLSRSPFEILLLGKRSYRGFLGRNCHLVHGRNWSTCRLGIKNIEPGLYSLGIGLLAGDRTLRYGSGMQLSIRAEKKPVWRGKNEFRSQPWQMPFNSWEGANGRSGVFFGRAQRFATKIKRNLRTLASATWSPGVIAHLDDFNGVPTEQPNPTRVPRNDHPVMRIVGWAVPRRLDTAFEAIIVRLIGKDNSVAALATLGHRPDIAKHFGNQKFLRSGIEWSYPMETLAAGLYSVEITGVDEGGGLHGTLAGKLLVE